MKHLLRHLKHNTVGYLALFTALGGTSYAAVSLPARSVGTLQLRNGAVTAGKLANRSITPAKLDPAAIGGSVRDWAHVLQDGTVAAGSRGARVKLAASQFTVTWDTRFSSRCAVLTTPGTVGIAPTATSIGAGIAQPRSHRGNTSVLIWTYANGSPTPAPFYIAVLC